MDINCNSLPCCLFCSTWNSILAISSYGRTLPFWFQFQKPFLLIMYLKQFNYTIGENCINFIKIKMVGKICLDVRSLCKGITDGISCIYCLIMLKIFPTLQNELNISGTFFLVIKMFLMYFH